MCAANCTQADSPALGQGLLTAEATEVEGGGFQVLRAINVDFTRHELILT